MLRTPIAAASLVLTALALLSTAAPRAHAAPPTWAFPAEEVSAGACPWLEGEREGVLPEGHPPVARDLLPPGHPPVDSDDLALPPGHPPLGGSRASRLPPGHPPVGGAPAVVPRFDGRGPVNL
jgi:hypothetical protein